MVRSIPVQLLISYLVQADDTSFVEDISDFKEIAQRVEDPPHLSLMVVLDADGLHGEGKNYVPLVGVGLIYKPPYVSAVDFSQALYILNLAVKTKKGAWIKPGAPQAVFLNITTQSTLQPLADPYPLWVDCKDAKHVNHPIETWSFSSLRGFLLQRVVSVPFATAGCTVMDSLPQGAGFCHLYMGTMEEDIPQSVMVSPTFTMKFAEPSPTHWAILADADFLAHLEAKKARAARDAEAAVQEGNGTHPKEVVTSEGKKEPKSKSGSSGSGKATTSKTSGPATRNKTGSKAHKAEASARGDHAESAVGKCLKEAELLERCEVDEDLIDSIFPNPESLLDQPLPESIWEAVQELLQSICSFQLQALHEMGGIRMVNWTLGEGLMAEFSRVSLMVDEDLNASLQHHHTKILGATNLLERNIKRLLSPLLSCTHNMELQAELAVFGGQPP